MIWARIMKIATRIAHPARVFEEDESGFGGAVAARQVRGRVERTAQTRSGPGFPIRRIGVPRYTPGGWSVFRCSVYSESISELSRVFGFSAVTRAAMAAMGITIFR